MAKKTKTRLSQADHQKIINDYSDDQLEWVFPFTREMLSCPAYRSLSGSALKVYMAMWVNSYLADGDRDKRHNARTSYSKAKYRDFVAPYNYLKCYGITNNRTLQKAINELIALQFITVVEPPTKTKPAKYQHTHGYKSLSQSRVNEIQKNQRCIFCTK